MINLTFSCAMEASYQLSLGRAAIPMPPIWANKDLADQDKGPFRNCSESTWIHEQILASSQSWLHRCVTCTVIYDLLFEGACIYFNALVSHLDILMILCFELMLCKWSLIGQLNIHMNSRDRPGGSAHRHRLELWPQQAVWVLARHSGACLK